MTDGSVKRQQQERMIPCLHQRITRNNAEAKGEVNLRRASLVWVIYKCGKSISPEYYRVLGFFSKYYNKWWVAEESFVERGDKVNIMWAIRISKKIIENIINCIHFCLGCGQ